MNGRLNIGTRSSALAQAQSALVEEALLASSPELTFHRELIQTAGDIRTDVPLHQVNQLTNTQDKGVFIAALEEALAAGQIDCAVHSLKDMPGTLDDRFEIAAVLPREVIHDVLVVKEGADLQAPHIGTSSVRRVSFAQAYWQGRARMSPIRGNVATRLGKLVANPEMDAILLAAAGLNRLHYPSDAFEVEGQMLKVMPLPVDDFMPALGQGAIAIEVLKGDDKVKALFASINDAPTEAKIRCEREFLRCLNADCSCPVGGYSRIEGDVLQLCITYFTPKGQRIRLWDQGLVAEPELLGSKLYDQLLAQLSD